MAPVTAQVTITFLALAMELALLNVSAPAGAAEARQDHDCIGDR
jgi:hypothetical protein